MICGLEPLTKLYILCCFVIQLYLQWMQEHKTHELNIHTAEQTPFTAYAPSDTPINMPSIHANHVHHTRHTGKA